MKNGDAAKAAAAKSAASRLRQAPLRRIVERKPDCEVLECGHEMTPPRGTLFAGRRGVEASTAARRRCLQCLNETEGAR